MEEEAIVTPKKLPRSNAQLQKSSQKKKSQQ